jgi:type IV pilus assembly protein PilW
MTTGRKRTSRRGFTLIELMIACGISVALISGLVGTYVQMRRAYKSMQRITELQQNVRAATDMVSRDLRMAGYGLPISNYYVSRWITWVAGMTANPMIVQGASATAPDRLHIAAAFDAPQGHLAGAISEGATLISLQSGEGANFDTSRRKVIFIGKSELARVVAVNGDSLTISIDPTVNAKGLRYDYPADAPVELIKVVTYSWSNNPNDYPQKPHLERDDNLDTLSYSWQRMVAGNIENFQVVPVGTAGYRVDISGRTDKRDNRFGGDGYRRMTMSSQIAPRNQKKAY